MTGRRKEGSRVTYDCNGEVITINANDPKCQADYAAFSAGVDPNAFSNCTQGTCDP